MRRRRLRKMGHVQSDILDSLLRNVMMTTAELAADTGRPYYAIVDSLRTLRRARCVSRERSFEGRRGAPPWLYLITPAGKRELELRTSAGIEPGVCGTWRRGRFDLACPR